MSMESSATVFRGCGSSTAATRRHVRGRVPQVALTADPGDPAGRAKQLQVTAGTDRSYAHARRHGVKVAWGTDVLFDASLAARQGKQLAKMTRWYTPAEVLASATSRNADLLADPDRFLVVIMKDGRIHNDTTPSQDL